MPAIAPDELRAILNSDAKPRLSLFMRAVKSGREVQQNSVRFKNLITQAEDIAQERKLDHDFREALRDIEQLTLDDLFWQHQGHGLAAYVDAHGKRFYRVPVELADRVEIGDRAVVLPILPVVQSSGVFYILAVSRNATRLLMATQDSVSEVFPPGMPESLWDEVGKKHFRGFHLHSFAVRARADNRAVPHGHPDPDDEPELNRYFNEIDAAVRSVLDEQRTPVVFAGDQSLFPLYKEASELKMLVGECIPGSPEDRTDEELQRLGWELVQPIFHRDVQAALDKLHNAMHSELGTSDLDGILAAAKQGAIEGLFVGADLIALAPGQEKSEEERRLFALADEVAYEVLNSDGQVHVVDRNQTGNQPMCALLRYAVPTA